jgi:hypothetical protein
MLAAPAGVQVCIDEKVAASSFFWGDPSEFVPAAHAAGITVVHQVGSVEAAVRAIGVPLIETTYSANCIDRRLNRQKSPNPLTMTAPLFCLVHCQRPWRPDCELVGSYQASIGSESWN